MNLREKLRGDGMLDRLNSATKYPSIPTYHEMGERGCLTDVVDVPFDGTDDILLTEKIDGTNARLIVFASGEYIIGSRNDLLHSSGDLISNPLMGIVEAVRVVASHAAPLLWSGGLATVFYGEVYGGSVGKNARQYTGSDGSAGFRVYDVAHFRGDEMFDNECSAIANWRKAGGQRFASPRDVGSLAQRIAVPVVPRIQRGRDSTIPTRVDEMCAWLREVFPSGSQAGLDSGAGGRPEGVVVRTADRSKIAKIRFQDYERTLRARKKA